MQNISINNQTSRAISRDKNYWREVITAWQRSDEHPRDLCARMNIKIGTFAHWRSVFNKEDKKKENKFIELQVTRPTQETLDPFIIECPTGHKIVFASVLKMEQAQQIFKLLGLAPMIRLKEGVKILISTEPIDARKSGTIAKKS